MKALVTGGAGFVASHLIDALLARGDLVTSYDLLATGSPHPNLTLNTGDLLDGYRLDEAVAGHDIIFHFAGNASVRGGTEDPGKDLEQNLMATRNVLESMRHNDVKQIVFASTSAVYGNASVVPTPEDCPFPVQTSFYGASKIAAESLISAYCNGFGMKATIMRFVPLLGERYHRGFVYDFWYKLNNDPTQIQVLGNGKQRHSYVYIRDAIVAVLLVTDMQTQPVSIFNVGCDETSSIDESLDVICKYMGLHPIRNYTNMPGWAGDSNRILDWSKLRQIGWKPTMSIRDSIQTTVRSFA